MNLNQVTIPVSNIDTSISFYEKLGLKLIVKSTPHYARFTFPEGDATFSLHLTEEIQNNSGAWIYFEDNNLDATIEKLISKGILIEEMPNDKPWLWREARIKDPDNNQLIIYYAGENRKDPPWKIHAKR